LNTFSATCSSCRTRAFSIVEMLIVIAVIGVISAGAVSFYGRYHREVILRVRDQRNAQEITSLAMGATAAGAKVIEANDMQGTILNLIEGRDGTVGSFKGHNFRLTNLTEEEVAGAMRFLQWRDGVPAYAPNAD
jgi:prepilin-type N-terminal cleavage/methylation domain-containing protein